MTIGRDVRFVVRGGFPRGGYSPAPRVHIAHLSSILRLCPVLHCKGTPLHPLKTFDISHSSQPLLILPSPPFIQYQQCLTFHRPQGKQSPPPPQPPDLRPKRNPERPSQKAPSEQSRAAILAEFEGRSVFISFTLSFIPHRAFYLASINTPISPDPVEPRSLLLIFFRNATSNQMQRVLAKPAFVFVSNVLASVQRGQTG